MQSSVAEVLSPGAEALQAGTGRLRPRARLLNSIGAELISSEIVAIIELVRNSYDADASRVQIIFDGLREGGTARLEIRDDGHGMTREVLLGPWMEPATDYKSASGRGVLAGHRSPAGRRRLGSKGVGRFAAQRLGRELSVVTRAPDSRCELIAHFDWREIESADKYLDQMQIPWRERRVEELADPGTILQMVDLRDEWTPDRFEKLRIGLGRLVSPDHTGDPFVIEMVVEGSREEVRSLIDRDAAMYGLEGTVDAQGAAWITYRDLEGTEEIWEREVLWPNDAGKNCGAFRFRISAWDLDREPLLHYLKTVGSPLGLRDFRRSLRDHSGISLYRDGFRILPYGEPDDDWLRLDRRRINNPTLRLSNNQVVGVIQLTADQNGDLQDQTNREGLVSNPAYEHLREVVSELLAYLENRRFAARRAGEMGWKSGGSRMPDMGVEADGKIETLLGDLGATNRAASVKALREALDERRQAVADTLRLYAGLATTGQLSGMIFSQFKHFLLQLDSELRLVEGDLDFDPDDLGEGFIDDLKWSFGRLRQICSDMTVRVDRLDPLAVTRRGRRVKRTSLGHCVTVILEAFEDLIAEREIDLRVIGDPTQEVDTNEAVIQQAFAAVLDNALHWTAQRPKGRRIIVELRKGTITVANNGPEIAKTDLQHIFDPHFTRREDAPGLGLTLARDLLQVVGASITVRTSPEETRFSMSLGDEAQ